MRRKTWLHRSQIAEITVPMRGVLTSYQGLTLHSAALDLNGIVERESHKLFGLRRNVVLFFFGKSSTTSLLRSGIAVPSRPKAISALPSTHSNVILDDDPVQEITERHNHYRESHRK